MGDVERVVVAATIIRVVAATAGATVTPSVVATAARATAGASGRLPFGGIGDSGNHRAAGITVGLACTHPVALLRDLDVVLRHETKLPILRSDDPFTAVVHGAGKALDNMHLLKEVALT